MTDFILDGRPAAARPGETIWQVASRLGIDIPHLCHRSEPGYRHDGNCRACVVEIEGERTLAPSCHREPKPGMVVRTDSERVARARRGVFELLLADQPAPRGALKRWADRVGVTASRYPTGRRPPEDVSHPAITVRLEACISCGLCVRACREVQGNDVIGMGGRGFGAMPAFDLGDSLGASTCVACGECVQACPTGALLPRQIAALPDEPEQLIDGLCPYCGVGCQVTWRVRGGEIVAADGRDGAANHNRLCVKGRFGFGYVHSPDRLTVPLVRIPGIPKRLDGNPRAQFREATWEEALDLAAGGLKRIRDRDGPGALAGFGSAKGSNEEAYLFQKLVRAGLGTNNVDHCTRLCHASSVAALIEGIGSGAVTAPISECLNSDVIVVIGSNPTVNHPVAASFIKNAVRAGAQLIVADPRGQALARHATAMLRFRPGSDVAMLNAIMNVIVTEGLEDRGYIDAFTEGFEAFRAHILDFPPERMAPLCGIEPAVLRQVARTIAGGRTLLLWGMGVSQHVHGTDNARCLIALALLTGNVGKAGAGLHPLRGQNNVQGASDSGLVPMFYPGYQPVDDPAVRHRFEALWGIQLDPRRGLTVVEIMHAAEQGDIRGMYVMGENPAMSDPDIDHARAALAGLEHLVVQDVFLTETAAFADVVLPASALLEKLGSFTNTDRRVQLGRPVVPPPGQARQDWELIQQIARRLGLDWDYSGPGAVWEELRIAWGAPVAGIPWSRLEREGAVIYPCAAEDQAGREVIFGDCFPTASGRARFVPAALVPPDERPDNDYPMVLITGRLLEHWHTGTMTRRVRELAALEPEGIALLSPADAARHAPEGRVAVETRRGRIECVARIDRDVPEGVVFVPFCFAEAPANRLTNPALDPVAKIPEFKYCAARLKAV